MKKIPLTQGEYALVDNEDFELVSQYSWRVSRKNDRNYAITGTWPNAIYMHHLILGLTGNDGADTDHEDRNGLNNCKENLRVCTRSQNNANRRKQNGTSSKYKGVTWSKLHNKWKAQLGIVGRSGHLGLFEDEIDAAAAYDIAALKEFGEFSLTNFEIAGGVGLS